jgi:hypothetical protein
VSPQIKLLPVRLALVTSALYLAVGVTPSPQADRRDDLRFYESPLVHAPGVATSFRLPSGKTLDGLFSGLPVSTIALNWKLRQRPESLCRRPAPQHALARAWRFLGVGERVLAQDCSGSCSEIQSFYDCPVNCGNQYGFTYYGAVNNGRGNRLVGWQCGATTECGYFDDFRTCANPTCPY